MSTYEQRLAEERERTQRDNVEREKLFNEVANLLGWYWKPQTDTDNPQLATGMGYLVSVANASCRVHCRANWKTKRLEFSGSFHFPSYEPHKIGQTYWANTRLNAPSFTITLAPNSDPHRIAKAIRSRLLPGYIAHFDRLWAQHIENSQYANKRELTAKLAARLFNTNLGLTVSRYSDGGERRDNYESAYLGGEESYYHMIQIVYDDSVRLSLDIPIDKLELVKSAIDTVMGYESQVIGETL